MNRRKFITTASVFALGIPTAALTADVTLQWNTVNEADGYKIYWGTDSRFLVCCSGTLASGPHYECNATISSGTRVRIDVDPPNKVMQTVTVDKPTVVPSPLDVIEQSSFMLVFDTPGTYYFAVTAYNNYGDSEFSEEVNAPISGNPGDVYNIRLAELTVPPPPGGSTFTNFYLTLAYG